MMRARQPQQGFALIAAIFLLVVLAALGAFMVTVSNGQHLTSAQDIQGSRAYWAARAGLEWGVAGVVDSEDCSAGTLSVEGFTVSVTCTPFSYDEGSATKKLFTLESVASQSGAAVGSIGFVERKLRVSVEI
ncbi:MAG: hypothetical protein Q8L79_09255 [Methylobacter sp.]|uniref:hypothetical protein n=1 Tax=Methylobacter sp. TaxID=2051955 RepID=UPI0027322BCB|nr:hypothetical protein [Methylobacter sp.]MDP1665302.1 hypothetical protein [Methylobacter sp.]